MTPVSALKDSQEHSLLLDEETLSEVPDLADLVELFAEGLVAADSRRPVAQNTRSGYAFQPGIGPHSESITVGLVMDEIRRRKTEFQVSGLATGVSYPEAARQKCDLVVGDPYEWAIEIKMLRILGDNGKANDNMLMHILSPYSSHRSALTDCAKLAKSSLAPKKAILIYGYEATDYLLETAISAFEATAGLNHLLGPRTQRDFDGLVHPVHSAGSVFAWQLLE